MRERKAKSLGVKIRKQNQGVNQGNQAARGSQEKKHCNTSLGSFSLAEGNTRLFMEADVKEKPVFHAEESTIVRKRRNCRKLEMHEMHVWLWADSH